MATKERRQYSRTKVEWSVDVSTVHRNISGQIKNMSLRGAYIRLAELPNLDEPFDLSIEVPEHNYALFAKAEAVRFDIVDDDDAAFSYGLGVRLIDYSEEEQEFLATTVFR